MLRDLKEIGKLGANGELRRELNSRLGGLGNRIPISDAVANAKLVKEMGDIEETMRMGNTKARNRSHVGRREEYIIDLRNLLMQ